MPDALKVYVYHDRGRNIDQKRLSQFDIVLTTYETAAYDISISGKLSRASWFRIVLDEGLITAISTFHGLYIDCII